MKKWKLNSWRNYLLNTSRLMRMKKNLIWFLINKNFPPLVFAGETRHLKQQLAEVVDGKAFYFKEVIVQKVLQNLIQII